MATEHGARIIPTMRYRDARAAIDWLCRAFGFERHMVVDGEGGTVAHAQLTFRGGMIMLGSARDDAFGRLVTLPAEAGAVTQSPYIVVEDADAHYARAHRGRGRGRHGHQGRGLRRARLFGARPGGASLELRHLRPVARRVSRPGVGRATRRPGREAGRR